MTQPAIAWLPRARRFDRTFLDTPLSQLSWPLGCPGRLEGGRIADLTARDHLITFPRTAHHFLPWAGLRARVSLVLAEPSAIHSRHLALLRLSHRRFFRILTFNEDLLARIPNGLFFPLGSTWVPEWRELRPDKTRMCSLIASAKRDSEGHRLRHAMVDWVRSTGRDVEVMGRGYTPFGGKAEGLAPYRYSIVIENVRERNYFSEKLLDAVFCETVPIYWGCPNLDRFVDPDGIIQCETEPDLRAAVEAMSEGDYAARLPALRRLKEAFAPYADLERRAAEALRDSL